MKLSKVVAAIVVIALIGEGYILLTKKSPQGGQSEQTQQSQAMTTNGSQQAGVGGTQESSQTQTNGGTQQNGQSNNNSGANSATVSNITTTTVTKNSVAYLNLTGSVRAREQVKVFPTTTGQITKIYANEGDVVKAGDPLFEIGGINGGKAIALTQLQIANTNYKAALKNLETTKSSNDVSLKIAELQLQGAKDQTNANYYDLQIFDVNKEGAYRGLDLLQNSYQAAETKTDYDLQKGELGIASLQNAITSLENAKNNLYNTYQSQIADSQDVAAIGKLQKDLAAKLAEIDPKLNDLYSQITNAQLTYQSGQQAAVSGLAAAMSPIITAQTQSQVLDLSQQSLANKLGIYDGSSAAIRLAEQSLEATKLKNEATLTQSQSAVELAKANLDLAKIQSDGLTVKAPIGGIVGDVTVRTGDVVAQTVPLTQISSAQDFELKVGLNSTDAQNIDLQTAPEIVIGGHNIKVSLKSISPIVDPVSKLVNVTLTLPKIFFRSNQNLNARIPVRFGGGGNGGGAAGAESYFVPLDSVIIGTQEQYVYLVKDGKAVKTNVQLGQINGAYVEILGGLNEQDVIVVNGAKNIIDGQLI